MKRFMDNAIVTVPVLALCVACSVFAIWFIAGTGGDESIQAIRDNIRQNPDVTRAIEAFNDGVDSVGSYLNDKMDSFSGKSAPPANPRVLPFLIIVIVLIPLIAFWVIGKKR